MEMCHPPSSAAGSTFPSCSISSPAGPGRLPKCCPVLTLTRGGRIKRSPDNPQAPVILPRFCCVAATIGPVITEANDPGRKSIFFLCLLAHPQGRPERQGDVIFRCNGIFTVNLSGSPQTLTPGTRISNPVECKDSGKIHWE